MGLAADPYPATGLSSPVRSECGTMHSVHSNVCTLYCTLYVFVNRDVPDVSGQRCPSLPHVASTLPQHRSTFFACWVTLVTYPSDSEEVVRTAA